MKKSIIALILTGLFAFAQAESLTKQGVVFSENNGKYWRVGKIANDGVKIVGAIIPADEASKISPFDGKMVIVTGEKDETWTGNIPKFKPGFTVEEVTE
jgi:hypothetical protein